MSLSNSKALELCRPLSMESVNLNSKIHGCGALRGQLWLSEAELDSVCHLIEPLGYYFCVIESPDDTTEVSLPTKKTNARSVPAPVPPLPADSQAETVAAYRPRRKVAQQPPGPPPAAPTPSTTINRRSSSGGFSGSEKKAKRQKAGDEFVSAVKHRASSTVSTAFDKSYKVAKSPKVPVLPTRTSRRRREALVGRWEDACLSVTSKLEMEPTARWFLSPVDPEAEQVPDYLEKIKCPMDFQTIKQKLLHGMYSHPFRWQEDVRTIFYNAFTYHSAGSLIWSDAHYLASLFEQFCRDNEGVNPYAVYSTPSLSKRPDRVSPSSNVAGSHDSTTRSGLRPSLITRVAAESQVNGSSAIGPASPMNRSVFEGSDTITLEASKLRELLERAASAAQHSEGIGKDKIELGVGSGKGLTPRNRDIFPEAGGKGGKFAEPASAASWQNASRRSQPNVQSEEPGHLPTLPPPTMPEPPGPPMAAAAKPGEKPPNITHKRLVAAQLKELDVHLRKAALELVKDELGVIPSISACDVTYTIDLELLPFLKQKQLLAYLRTLIAFQRKKQEEGFKVRQVHTLTTEIRPPTSNVSSAVHPPPSQQPSESNLPSPTRLHKAYISNGPGPFFANDENVDIFAGRPTSIQSPQRPSFSSHGALFDPNLTGSSTLHQSRPTAPGHPPLIQSTQNSSSSSSSSSSDSDEESSSASSSDSDKAKNSKVVLPPTKSFAVSQSVEEIEQQSSNVMRTTSPSLFNNTLVGKQAPQTIAVGVAPENRNAPPIVVMQNQDISDSSSTSSSDDEEEVDSSDEEDTVKLNACIAAAPNGLQQSATATLQAVSSKNASSQALASRTTLNLIGTAYGQNNDGRKPTSNHETVSQMSAVKDVIFSQTDAQSKIWESRASSASSENSSNREESEDEARKGRDGDFVMKEAPAPSYLLMSDAGTRSYTTEQIEEQDDDDDEEAGGVNEGNSEVTSSWGEWKAKVIQDRIRQKMGEEEYQDSISAANSETERAAELADAEI